MGVTIIAPPSSSSFSGDAGDVPFTPAGTVAATTVQAAIEEVAAEATGIANVLDANDVALTSPAEGQLLGLGAGGTSVVNLVDVTLDMASNTVLLGQGAGNAPIAATAAQLITALALTGAIAIFDTAPVDGTAVIVVRAPYAMTINSFTADVDSGTVSVVTKINGTDVTGLAGPVAVSSTKATTNATAANTVAAGDEISIVYSSASTPVNFRATLNYTRTGV